MFEGTCGLDVRGAPIALLAANSKLSKICIIVKGGLRIENLKYAGTVVFDKTGTLTAGKPVISQGLGTRKDPKPLLLLDNGGKDNELYQKVRYWINHPILVS